MTMPCVNGTCIDDVATFRCDCDAGFHGDNCELQADECLSTPCGFESTCVDEINAYRCSPLLHASVHVRMHIIHLSESYYISNYLFCVVVAAVFARAAGRA